MSMLDRVRALSFSTSLGGTKHSRVASYSTSDEFTRLFTIVMSTLLGLVASVYMSFAVFPVVIGVASADGVCTICCVLGDSSTM